MTEYKVALDIYNGPLDLLLFLIRREEIDIYNIPIARITEQYLAYVNLLTQLDPETTSEFLVLAATLMEIKSRTLLPRPPADELDEEMVDPRLELVRQLLEYKKFKDAARELEESAALRETKHPRTPAIPPPPPDELELDNVEIWDLFDAFKGLLEQIGKAAPYHEVGVDDTPLTLHADDILDSLQRAGGTQPFDEVFAGRDKSEMIGLFLALLELVRQRRVRAAQESSFATIYLHLLDATPLTQLREEDEEEAPEEVPAEPAAEVETDSTEEAMVESAEEDPADSAEEAPEDAPGQVTVAPALRLPADSEPAAGGVESPLVAEPATEAGAEPAATGENHEATELSEQDHDPQ